MCYFDYSVTCKKNSHSDYSAKARFHESHAMHDGRNMPRKLEMENSAKSRKVGMVVLCVVEVKKHLYAENKTKDKRPQPTNQIRRLPSDG